MKRYSLLIIFLSCISLIYGQEGTLDPTFASKGWTTFANYPKGNYSSGWITKTLIQGEKLLSIMYIDGRAIVARFNQNGTLDATFGIDGYSKAFNLEYPNACLQSDGRIIVVGNTYNPSTEQREIGVIRLSADGVVDNSFGTSGMAMFGPGWAWDEGQGGVACQVDDKIVIAANYYDQDLAAYFISIARLTGDGILDSSFDTDGIAQINNNYWCPPTGIAIQSDEKIVISGFISLNGYRFYALRLNPTGTVDTGFGTNGFTYVDFGNMDAICRSIALQSNGYIILAGQHFNAYGDPKLVDFALARLDGDGALDNSFGGTGTVTTDFGNSYDYVYSVAINSSNGKIIAVGGTEQSINEVAIACYNSNGTLDTGFDTDGKQVLTFANNSWGYSVSLTDSKILVGGYSWSSETDESFAGLALLNANGSFDTGFDSDGILAFYYPSNLMNYFNSVALQSNGKAIVLGAVENASDYDADPILLRYNENGTLDETFGSSGKVLTLLDTYGWFPAMQVAGDDKIVVAGYVYSTTYSDLAILKFNSNGTPDLTFGTNGQVIVDFGKDVYASAVYISPANQIVVAGEAYNETGDSSDVLIAGFTSAGVPDNSFGISGYTIIDFADGQWEWGNGIAALSTGYIVSAGTWSDTETDAIEKYALALIDNNGALNTDFDGDGKLISDGPSQSIGSIMTLPEDKIAISGRSNNKFIIAMYNSDGTLNTSFGTTGLVTIDVNTPYEDVFLSIQDDYKFLLTGSTGFYPNEDITTVRIGSNGIPDATFGTGGTLVTDLGSNEAIRSTIWGNDRLYTVGTYEEAFENIGLVAVFNTASSFTAAPAITLDKTISSGSPYDAVGDLVNYSFRITNSGNVAIAGPFTVTDDKIGEVVSNNSLGIGEHLTIGGTYTITQADIDAGAVTNVAYATTMYEASTVTSGTDTETAMATQNAALTINKQITGGDPYTQVGDVINYSYTVTNSGNVTLAGPFTITDNKIGTIPGSGPLAPGDHITVNDSYTIIQSDMTAGLVSNVAYATTIYQGTSVNSGTDTETAYASSTPPTITINDVTLNEASPGAALTVTLNKPSTNAIVVNYDTEDGTATSKGRYPDYKSTRGTATILPGSTTGMILVTMKDDGRAEPEQHFYVNLALSRKMTGLATISDGIGIVTISAHGGALIPDEEARMSVSDKDDLIINKLVVKAYPNPTTGFFTLQVQSAYTAPVTIRVMDATGKLIESRTGVAANSNVQLGNNYRPGVYYAEVVQDNEKVTVKLVKQSD